MNHLLREARRRGVEAAKAHLLHGEAPPANPFRPSTKCARFWRIGLHQATALIDELDRL